MLTEWKANWIWHPKSEWTVNFHFFARKVFEIDSPVTTAELHISAMTDCQLFLNGKFVGRGPTPGHPWQPFYDTYSIADRLQKGENIIGVVCHNYGIGVHWQPKGQGGLIVQLEMETQAGRKTLVSDETWKVKKADCWAQNSPRMFWSCGFTETFDFRKYDRNWLTPNCDANGWEKPELFGKHPAKLWLNLIPREIPFLIEEEQKPVFAEKGRLETKGFHAISFDGIISPGENRIGYAQTYFHTGKERKVILNISCDDAFKVLLNDNVVLEQGYDEEYARTRIWYGRDEYEQHHYGMGLVRNESETITLKPGWNKILVAVDQGTGGWGFSLSFKDPATGKPIDFPFSNIKDKNRMKWTLAGPYESSGMNDSLQNILREIIAPALPEETFPNGRVGQPCPTDLSGGTGCPALPKLKSPVIEMDPFDYGQVTDYSGLMQAEERNGITPAGGAIELGAGQFCIISFDKLKSGFPCLEIDSQDEAVLDVGYGFVLRDDKKITLQGRINYVDRIYTAKGRQKWERFQRISGRYMHVSCRKGSKVRLKALIKNISYPAAYVDAFESSDPMIDRIWETSKYTLSILMQYSFMDCLRREEGNCNGNTFNYAMRAAACGFGDYKLSKRAYNLVMQTREKSGWFYGLGATSPNNHSTGQPLWWIVWAADYYTFSGDAFLIRETYDVLVNYLRYVSKMSDLHGLLECKNRYYLEGQGHIWLDDAAPMYNDFMEGELFSHNILYFAALNSMAFLADELGFAEDAAFYKRKALRVKQACNERFWDKTKNLYVDWRKEKEISEVSSHVFLIAALYFDLCDTEKAEKVLSYLCDDLGGAAGEFEKYQVNLGFYYYFLEVLFRAGRDDMAVNLMKAYYGRWLELGATTFGEHFNLSQYKDKPSLDEEYEVNIFGVSAYPHFHSNILGIKPAKPGFKEIVIEPHPGGLRSAKGSLHIPQGEVKISWKADEPVFILEAQLPPNIAYKLKLPPKYSKPCIKVTRQQADAHPVR